MTVQPGTGTPVVDTALLAAAAAASLEDWGPLAEATGAPMQTYGVTLWSFGDDDEGPSAGVWDCTAGPSYWVQEQHEFVHILSGTLTVTPDGGTPASLGPGDCAVFPRGWRGTWELHETVRKVYVLF